MHGQQSLVSIGQNDEAIVLRFVDLAIVTCICGCPILGCAKRLLQHVISMQGVHFCNIIYRFKAVWCL